MTLRDLPHFAFAASFLLASAGACGGDKPAEPAAAPAAPAPEPAPAPSAPAPSVAPTPAPEAPAPPNPAAAPAAAEHPAARAPVQPEPAAHVAKPTRDSDTSVPTPAAAKHAQTPASQSSTKVVPPAPVQAAAAPDSKPQPTVVVAPAKPIEPAAAVAPAAPTASKVVVPRTDHVHIDVPKGLQAWLDADTRMEPWLGKVIKVIDACYANARKDDPNTAGVIVVKIKMHKDERPDADIASSPTQLGGVVGCATTKLLGARPPLFTGKEGEKYTVQIHFEK